MGRRKGAKTGVFLRFKAFHVLGRMKSNERGNKKKVFCGDAEWARIPRSQTHEKYLGRKKNEWPLGEGGKWLLKKTA